MLIKKYFRPGPRAFDAVEQLNRFILEKMGIESQREDDRKLGR